MQYRELGNTGLRVSAIGLGTAQLGSSSTAYGVQVVRRALEKGVTYFDLARGYRDAEITVGKALAPGERQSLVLSTKTGQRTQEEAWREINESLERVGTDHFDNVHLHGLRSREDIDRRLGPGGAIEALLQAREQGMVHHIGFSSHHAEVAVEAVQRFPFEVVLVILNLLNQATLEELIPLCRQKGIGVTVMKPVATGLLPAPLALKWVLNAAWSPPIACAVPGATTIEEAEENALVGHGDLALSEADLAQVRALQDEWAHKRCRICRACEPCPVDIPLAITLGTDVMYDHYRTMGREAFRAFSWARSAVERELERRARVIAAIESCDRCGECEAKCPYGLPVIDMLQSQVVVMRDMMGIYQEVLGR
jgi:predicted aldo/keto reductase-like oxidoreductase